MENNDNQDENFNEEQIQTYLDFLRETIQIITLASDPTLVDCMEE